MCKIINNLADKISMCASIIRLSDCVHKIIVIEIKRKETIKCICQFLCQV